MVHFIRCLIALLAGLIPLAGCGRNEADELQWVREEIRRLGYIRPIEPRLILETGWAPCATEPRKAAAGAGCSYEALIRTELPTRRCSPLPSQASSGYRQLVNLARRLDRRPLQERSAALAALPLFIEADESNTTATILALKAFGRQQDALTDLSAVYLHLAGVSNRPHLLLESLEASSEVLVGRPDDPRALFNWALGLSQLNLVTTAHHAWTTYLKTTPADGWAMDARDHLSRVTSGTYQQRWVSEAEEIRKAARAGEKLETEGNRRASPSTQPRMGGVRSAHRMGHQGRRGCRHGAEDCGLGRDHPD